MFVVDVVFDLESEKVNREIQSLTILVHPRRVVYHGDHYRWKKEVRI